MAQSSSRYWVAQILLFILLLAIHTSGHGPAYKMQVVADSFDSLLFGILHALHFVLISHFFLIPFVEMYILRSQFTAWIMIACVLFLVALSLLQLVLTVGHMHINALLTMGGDLSLSNLAFDFMALPKNPIIWFFPVSYYVVIFSLWSICYSVASLYRDRRVLAGSVRDLQSTILLNQLNPHFL